MTTFTWASLGLAAIVVVLAASLRGRVYAMFATVLLGIHTVVSATLFESFSWCWPVFVYLQLTVYLQFASLVRPALRPLWYRALVSVPGSFFLAGTFLAAPWAVASAFGADPSTAYVAYGIASFGLLQSLWHRPEEIDITLDGAQIAALKRHPHGEGRVERPLRIVQITDPHLGPFMSEGRLRAICEHAVERDPDLVLLTGDFVTMESHRAEDALARALGPLTKLPGRVFACLGNHDHEAPQTVARALATIGAKLLVDEATTVTTPAGLVQIVGMDFSFRKRKERMAAVTQKYPRIPGALRMILLHDPGAFRHLDEGEGDIVLAGHTHGGQLGLLSLGLRHTIVSALSQIPDHGLWAHGKNRLYVHRGTGHYGFPLRVGVPAENSLVRLHWLAER